MKEFQYRITDPVGIHARPAGLLVQEAKKYGSAVTIEKKGRSSDARKLMKLISLGVKQHDTITVKVEGPDEEAAAKALEEFMKEKL